MIKNRAKSTLIMLKRGSFGKCVYGNCLESICLIARTNQSKLAELESVIEMNDYFDRDDLSFLVGDTLVSLAIELADRAGIIDDIVSSEWIAFEKFLKSDRESYINKAQRVGALMNTNDDSNPHVRNLGVYKRRERIFW